MESGERDNEDTAGQSRVNVSERVAQINSQTPEAAHGESDEERWPEIVPKDSGGQKRPAAAPLRAMGSPVSLRRPPGAGRPTPNPDGVSDAPSTSTGAQFEAVPKTPPRGAYADIAGILQGQSQYPSSPPPAEKFTPPVRASDTVSTGSLEVVVLSDTDVRQSPGTRPPVIVTTTLPIPPVDISSDDSDSIDAKDAAGGLCGCCSSPAKAAFHAMTFALVFVLATLTGILGRVESGVHLADISGYAAHRVIGVFTSMGSVMVVLVFGSAAVMLGSPVMEYVYTALLAVLLVGQVFVARGIRDTLSSYFSELMDAWPTLPDAVQTAIQTAGRCCGDYDPLDFPGPSCPAPTAADALELPGCRFALEEVVYTARDTLLEVFIASLVISMILAGLAIFATHQSRLKRAIHNV